LVLKLDQQKIVILFIGGDMLKSFTVRNFQSFHEQVHISLEMNKQTPDDNRAFMTPLGSKLTKVLAVICQMLAENDFDKVVSILGLVYSPVFSDES
jgi:hypothetical protein